MVILDPGHLFNDLCCSTQTCTSFITTSMLRDRNNMLQSIRFAAASSSRTCRASASQLHVPRRLLATPSNATDEFENVMHSVEAIAGLGSNSKHAKSPPSPTLPTPAPAPAPAYRPSKSFQAPTFAHDPTQIHIPPADDPLLAYLTARIQTHGERSKAARHTSRILLHLHAFTRRPPLPILREAIERASPAVRIINIKKSMKSVAHPVALSEKQRAWRGIEHMIVAAKQRNESEFAERFARVALDVLKGDRDKEKISLALKAKIQIHGMAVVNRGNVFKKMT